MINNVAFGNNPVQYRTVAELLLVYVVLYDIRPGGYDLEGVRRYEYSRTVDPSPPPAYSTVVLVLLAPSAARDCTYRTI